jgi:hypothetical protein
MLLLQHPSTWKLYGLNRCRQKNPDFLLLELWQAVSVDSERQIAATAELVNEEEQLSDEDTRLLIPSLTHLTSDTPSTALAATRFKRIVSTVGGAFKTAMYKFTVDFSSEAVKKIPSCANDP